MIEKFSDEELKQILSELGINGKICLKKSSVLKSNIMCEKRGVIIRELGQKPIDAHIYIMKIIDYALNNFDYSFVSGKYRAKTTVNVKDISEYKEMYNEIYEIVKKHNRKWENDYQEE